MSYRGNPNLKRIGHKVEWTVDRASELKKCRKDPIYFIENYMKIVNIDHGLINFNLYSYQKQMILDMKESQYSAFCWARQSGKSIAVCGFFLWYIIFHPYKTVGILANKGDTAMEILGRVQMAYQYLPNWMTHGIVEWNKGSFELENQSRIIAAATSSDNVRGYSFNIVYLDECAFIENWDKFSASVLPTISSGKTSKIVMTSTPNGLNHFYKTIRLGEKRGTKEWNGYKVMKVKWHQVPGRDEDWRQRTLAALDFDQSRFDQEYNVEFMGSSGSLIAGWKLKELIPSVPIQEMNNEMGPMLQYEMPDRLRTYFLSADVSEGKGLDYSAFSIIDITEMPYKQVCTFKSNTINPSDFGTLIHEMALKYNNAHVLIECNSSMGEECADTVFSDYEYDNMLFTEAKGRAGKCLVAGFGSVKIDKGIKTSIVTKNKGCSMLKILIEQNQLIIHDGRTIEELGRFVKKGKSWEAEDGCYDDLTMGLVNFSWASNQVLFKELTDINTMVRLREIDEERIEQEVAPFGFIDDGQPEPEIIDEPTHLNWLWR